MPFCPQCRSEYVSGIKRCAECGVALVAALPEDIVELDEDEWKIVYTTMQDYEAAMIKGRLEEEGILARVLSQADHAIGINIGDLAVVHVLVHRDDMADAKRIINEDESIDPDTLDDLAAGISDDE